MEDVSVWCGMGNGVMFDWLVGWVVFVNVDGVMGYDEDCWDFYQGCQMYCRVCIVGEGYEGVVVRVQVVVQCNVVYG